MNKDTDHVKAVQNSKNPAALPSLLQQVKESTSSILLAHLENLFGSCDDLFFDLSSRAASNSEQNLYFESMREVRLKKNGVISAFKSEFESGFHIMGIDSNDDSQKNEPTGPLSLVQSDALEQDVAISSMAKKAQANCQESLYHLNLRFDYLMPNININEKNNPLDPEQICNYFAQSCNLLEINIKARIILFKQFDRTVISKLATIYTSANNLLIEAGVLPKTQNYQRTNSSSQQDTINAQAISHFEHELAELSSLLDNIRHHSPELLSSVIPNYQSYSSNPGPAVANHELLNLLAQLQKNITPKLDTEELSLMENLRQIINELLSSQGHQQTSSLEQPDDDVINLVAMFFDFVLDDKNLPVPVQALISRLQIPVLRIALKEKDFFNDSHHPARQLINAIAEASIGWDEATQPQKDRLFSLISDITQEINEKSTGDENIFAIKLEELRAFISKTEHKSSLIQKRTGQAAEGKAKTELAKAMAQSITYEKMQAIELPQVISSFLTGHWLNLLVMIHLKHNTDSTEWVEAVQLIDDLIWASQAHQDDRSRNRFIKIKPDLLERIEGGMIKIANTPESAKAMVGDIESALNKIQQGELHDLSVQPMSTEQAQELGHTPGSGSKAWQDMTGVERQQAKYKQLTYDFIKKAEELPINTWLSYTDIQTSKTVRCKLAARVEASDSFVFVNRFGFKALEKPRKDFALDMQSGRAVVLEQSPLFDRAMGSIFSNLNKIARNSATEEK